MVKFLTAAWPSREVVCIFRYNPLILCNVLVELWNTEIKTFHAFLRLLGSFYIFLRAPSKDDRILWIDTEILLNFFFSLLQRTWLFWSIYFTAVSWNKHKQNKQTNNGGFLGLFIFPFLSARPNCFSFRLKFQGFAELFRFEFNKCFYCAVVIFFRLLRPRHEAIEQLCSEARVCRGETEV